MTQSIDFVIVGAEQNSVEEIKRALTKHPEVSLLAVGDDWEQIFAKIVRYRPAAVIITFGSQPDKELARVKQLVAECPETLIIGAAQGASTDLVLNSLRAGVKEFLRLPVIAAEFEAVLDRVAENAGRQATLTRKRGRIVAVFSNKGGGGASFIAANLALSLAAPTLLVDLNLQSGDLEFFFRMEPKFTITDVMENLTRADHELLEKLVTPYSQHLWLLPAPRDVDAALGIKSGQVTEMLDLMRDRYDYIVLDLAHTFDELTLTALDQADEILLVLTLDIMSIRSAQRALTIFDRLGYAREKVSPVVNRWDKKSMGLDWGQVERFLGKCITSFLPEDSRAVVDSINLGRPLIDSHPHSPVAAELRRLAAKFGEKRAGDMVEQGERAWVHSASKNESRGENNGHSAAPALTLTSEQQVAVEKTWKTRIISVFQK
ncbi:MAG TPA: AAA family ATPase [Blastocatellia bacterium]|nr:AAA family ATPase [Blastocatellia bacterium]